MMTKTALIQTIADQLDMTKKDVKDVLGRRSVTRK